MLSSSLLFAARRRPRVHVRPPRRAPASAPVTPDGRCRDAARGQIVYVSRPWTTARRGRRQGRSRGALPHGAPRVSRGFHHRRRRPPAAPAMVVILARGRSARRVVGTVVGAAAPALLWAWGRDELGGGGIHRCRMALPTHGRGANGSDLGGAVQPRKPMLAFEIAPLFRNSCSKNDFKD